MNVRILVEYEVLGDNEYAYVEWIDHRLPNDWDKEMLKSYARLKAIRTLISRGIIVKSIKELDISYED